jgi:hypothetical protein
VTPSVELGPGRLAFANARPLMFLSLRMPVYVFNIVSSVGWAQDRPWVIVATLNAAVFDLLIAALMWRRSAPLYGLRVAMDLLYVALACVAVPPTWPYSGVLYVLAPLAIDLIAVRGLLPGSGFALLAGLTMYGARRGVGSRPYTVELVFYGLWVLVVGSAAFAVLDNIGRQHRHRFLDEQQAFELMVNLQTQNDFFLGRGGAVVEALNAAWSQLSFADAPDTRERGWTFRRRQSDLSAATRQNAAYLGDVLREIGRRQREGRPAVAEHLHFTLDREPGLQVLTPSQSSALADRIDQLDLQGLNHVAVASSDLLTGELILEIGQFRVHVPPQGGRALPLVPAAVILGGGSMLALANPVYADLPLGPVVGAIVITIGLGLTAERRRVTNRVLGPLGLWVAGMTPAYSALFMTATLAVHWRLTDGRVIIPAVVGLTSSLYIIGAAWRYFSIPLQAGAVAGIATWLVIAPNMNPLGTPSWRYFVGELCIPVGVILAVGVFSHRNRELGQQLYDAWIDEFRTTEAALSRACQQSMLALLEGETETVEAALRLATPSAHTQRAQEHVMAARRHLYELTDDKRPNDVIGQAR